MFNVFLGNRLRRRAYNLEPSVIGVKPTVSRATLGQETRTVFKTSWEFFKNVFENRFIKHLNV